MAIDGGRRPSRTGQILSQVWLGIAVVGVLSFCVNILVLVSPIFSMQLFDRVMPSRSTSTLFFLTMFCSFAILILSVLESLRSKALSRIARWFDEAVRKDVFAASITSSVRSGSPVVYGMQDLQTLRNFIASSGPVPLFDAPWVPVFLIVLAVLHPWLGVLSVLTAAILVILALLNDKVTRAAMAGVSEQQMKLTASASLALRNADVIQSMGMHGALERRFLEQNTQIQNSLARAADRGASISAISKFVRIGVQIGIMALGAKLVLQNELTSGGMIAASIILGRALAPIEQAIGVWRSLIGARESYSRIRGLLNFVEQEGEDPMSLSAPKGHVSVDQLSFAAPTDPTKPVLKQLSFELKPGSGLAIIGPSASGKSTLCRLLAGTLKPGAGHVRLDGADLYRWNRGDIGKYVGYLPQSVELFAAPVKDNIARLGSGDPAAIERAAVLAGCDGMIRKLQNGYETNVGDAGVYLSGGQRQRIGLARAVYGMPKLIVLDEPDSNLDEVGIDALVKAILALRSQGTTIILVTHRPALIRSCDKTMVLHEGKIELFGDTKDVTEKLAELQQKSQQRVRQVSPQQAPGLPPPLPRTEKVG